MTARTTCNRLQVATVLYRFIEDKVLPGTGLDSTSFWKGFDAIAHDLAPKNAALLAERDRLQTLLDQWHTAHCARRGRNHPLRELCVGVWLYGAGFSGRCSLRRERCRRHNRGQQH